MWVWLKITQEGLRRFWSMFPLARVPFWYRLLSHGHVLDSACLVSGGAGAFGSGPRRRRKPQEASAIRGEREQLGALHWHPDALAFRFVFCSFVSHVLSSWT